MAVNQKMPRTKKGRTKKGRTKKVGNQYMVDPRQSIFLANYLDQKSPTFSNALQSALAAGYAQEYAENITSQAPDWLSERLGELRSEQMLRKAERNLDEMLDLPSKVQALGQFGPIFEGKGKDKKPVMTYAPTLLKIKIDTSQFIAERLGKSKYGSKGSTSVNLQVNVFSPDQVTRVATRVLNGDSTSEGTLDRLSDSDEPTV